MQKLFAGIEQHRVLAAVIVLAGMGTVLFWSFWWRAPSPQSQQLMRFGVLAGQGARQIGAELERAGLVQSGQVFAGYVTVRGIVGDLKAGTYVLSPAMTIPQIADIIAGGKGLSDDRQVTVPEGVNIWEVDRILQGNGVTDTPGEFSSVYGVQEGRIFPETYRFRKDAPLAEVIARMQNEFTDRTAAYSAKDAIVASLLEKEANTAGDMAMVSGIIERRLAAGMPLQIDATVAYGWCLRTVGYSKPCDVTQAPLAAEVKVDSPYNTYTRKGLPAGSISNPGLQALEAAAHPKASPYLYYLSTRDGSRMIYAKTLQEHLLNRQNYLGF